MKVEVKGEVPALPAPKPDPSVAPPRNRDFVTDGKRLCEVIGVVLQDVMGPVVKIEPADLPNWTVVKRAEERLLGG